MDFSSFVLDLARFQICKRDKWIGSYSCVSVVTEKSTGLKYAAKVFSQSFDDFREQQRYFKEIFALVKLQHPSVIRFIGFNILDFDGKNNPTILLEFAPNGSLRDFLDGCRYNSTTTKTQTMKQIFIIGIANAMKYLHSIGVWHCDLKPENILLDINFFPKICDFGFSRFWDNENKLPCSTCSALGSPIYMAPEYIKDDTEFDSKIDVYSFALILYEIVSGKMPKIDAASDFELLKKVINGERPNLSFVSHVGFFELISQCLESDPNKRPSFSQIVQRLLTDQSLLLDDVDVETVNQFLSQFGLKCSFKLTIPNKNDIPNFSEMNKMNQNLVEQALAGDIDACSSVGINLATGFNEFPKCRSEAMKYLQIAIDGNDANAIHMYAVILDELNDQKNKEIVANLFKRAADKGNGSAMLAYAKITKDRDEAARYMRMAAESGNILAKITLGDCMKNDSKDTDPFLKSTYHPNNIRQ